LLPIFNVMQIFSSRPKIVGWVLQIMGIFLLAMFLYRLLFYISYNPLSKPFSGSCLLMGLRFDVKFVCILGFTMLVFCLIPFLNPFKYAKASKFWNWILPLLFMIGCLMYITDYFFYDYLQQRLNATIFTFTEDAGIASHMMWQTYPVIKILLMVLVLTIFIVLLFKTVLKKQIPKHSVNKKQYLTWYTLCLLLFAWGVFGKVGQFNLRWSDAFTLSDNFKANVALNPFQSFFSSLKFSDNRPNVKKVQQHYALMTAVLGVDKPNTGTLNFERKYAAPLSTITKPNIVLVICESFSMYRSSMSSNPLNTTPFFNQLCQQGIFFNRCFTPSFPTARGVWATVTSIPDVMGDNNRTASRNPSVVNQHSIINDFEGYEKYYFLGGDPTWANIKGLMINNIDELHLYSQDDFKAPKVNVWGIDDEALLLESADILGKQQKPFFAVIQTADNHRPYTTPVDGKTQFKNIHPPKDTIEKYGFEDEDQLNAFRYTDYCFEKFITTAKNQPYFKNTIFVFVGDHGMPGNATSIYPKSFTEHALTREHVPLLFYAPAILTPKTINTVCSQVDILPTIAGVVKIGYRNNSIGRDLFTNAYTNNQFAFIIDHEASTIGTVSNDYYFIKNTKSGIEQVVSVKDNQPIPKAIKDSVTKQFSVFTEAYFETSKYLLFNNKKTE
jgi:phosphoglycerol transferase MdoB-like AlkP superfamily enzyme